MDSIINRVGSAKLLSTFDAASAYSQTIVRPGDEPLCPLTAFICDDGVYEFLRTHFGGRSCGFTFIRAMQQVVKPIRGFTEGYVDDLFVHTHVKDGKRIFQTHLQQIGRFLKRIKETGITIKLRKCRLVQPEVKFCGKIVGSGGRRPDPEKVVAIQGSKPKCVALAREHCLECSWPLGLLTAVLFQHSVECDL